MNRFGMYECQEWPRSDAENNWVVFRDETPTYNQPLKLPFNVVTEENDDE